MSGFSALQEGKGEGWLSGVRRRRNDTEVENFERQEGGRAYSLKMHHEDAWTKGGGGTLKSGRNGNFLKEFIRETFYRGLKRISRGVRFESKGLRR